MAARDFASSVQGASLRITSLLEDGSIDTQFPVLTTTGYISASFSSEYEDGDEITEKAANGAICISWKADDTLKRLNFNLSLCSPDPEAAALLAGGQVICDTNGEVIGYTSPPVGSVAGNPVAIEIWSIANIRGKPAAGTPYFHWVFPYVKVRYDGDREFSNSALANQFSGQGLGNEALAVTGLNPDDPADDFVLYKDALVNPFSYVRTAALPPEGWSGPFVPTVDNSLYCDIGPVVPGSDSASPGDTFTDARVTASDSTNAAALIGYGYVADPQTAWTASQKMTIDTFDFFWNSTAWQPGAASAAATRSAPSA
jgi:hypothetical protein